MNIRTVSGSTETDQLELIQRLGRIGYWEYDPDAHSFFLPPHSLELLSSLIDQPCASAPNLRDFMLPPERRRFRSALDQAIGGRLNLNLELQLERHGAASPTILVKGMPVERDGKLRFGGTFKDITPERRMEAEREEVLSQLQAVVSGLPIGVTVFDEELRLLFWNDHIYDILGLPQGAVYKFVRFEDLIGYPARRGEYGPGDPDELVAQRAVLARKFEPHRFERSARDGRTLLVDGYPFRFGGRVSGFVTTYTDITEQKHNAEKVEHQNQVLKTILDNFPGAVSLFDGTLRMAACNAQFKTLLEMPDSLIDRPVVYFEDLIRFNVARGEYGPGNPEEQIAAIMERARNFQSHKIERFRPNGMALEIIGAPIPGGGFVTLYIDITERKRVEEQIRNMALRDALTGLPNRISLNEQIDLAFERGNAVGERFALLFLDLDGFKKVNDSLGHDIGDALLVEVARRLREAVRETDTVARLGGDEFVILLREIESPAVAERIADAIIEWIAQPFTLQDRVARVGTSIGIAFHPDSGSSREALLKAADGAMYAAKAGGRGIWRRADAAQADQ